MFNYGIFETITQINAIKTSPKMGIFEHTPEKVKQALEIFALIGAEHLALS